MYRFTIKYYFEETSDGVLNYNRTRIGVVFASNRIEAISKMKEIDDCYKGIADLTFEEWG